MEVDQVVDVDPNEALSEGEVEQNSTRPRPGAQTDNGPTKEQIAEDMAALAPKAGSREWKIGPPEQQRTYIQRELSVIGKAQWFGLVGEFLDKALSGDNALSLNNLLAPPQFRNPGVISPADFQDADLFVHAVGKLLTHTPEFLGKSVCIWLSVPDYEWDLVQEMMKQSPEVGGMSDDMFQEIFETFIDQNYKAINTFFRQRFPQLRARWQARAKEANPSQS
jgi:hypothetical protein